jgi:flagellar biosynthetic protein FliR
MDPAADLLLWVLVLVRAGGLIFAMPVLHTGNIPPPVKAALSVLLAVLTTPLLSAAAPRIDATWMAVHLVFIELGTGVLLGFMCRFAFFALDVAGSLVANDLGLSMAAVLNHGSGSQTPVISSLLYWTGVMILFALDLHHWILAAFVRTYAAVPVGAGHLGEGLLRHFLAHTGWILSAGLQLAAPVMAVSFLITLVFSLLGRVVPQMNVFAESMPVRTSAGLFVFGSSLGFVGDHAANFLRRIPDDLVRVAMFLGKG